MSQEFQIPAGVPHWSQRVELDGSTYYIAVRWNPRVDRWFWSLSDSEQQPIIEGRKMLGGRDLLRGVASPRKPPGMLFAMDWSGRNRPPNEANFDGEQVGLAYVPFSEVPT